MKMRLLAAFFFTAPFAAWLAATAQFPSQIKNVIVIFQENRTPDNLFHALTPACPLPANPEALNACTPSPITSSCYDISPCGLSKAKNGTPQPVTLTAVPLFGSVDPDHTHHGFENMCDPDPTTKQCRNDGAYLTTPSSPGAAYGFVRNDSVVNTNGSKGHLLDPYLTLAKDYGWANFMYQTNQGPSYPAHQFLFSGTSALTATDDAKATFISENFNSKVIGGNAGCYAPSTAINSLLTPIVGNPPNPLPKGCVVSQSGASLQCPIDNTALVYPDPASGSPGNPVGTFCYPHKSMADVLNKASISWKYYAPSDGSIWTAPDSFAAICKPVFVKHVDDKGNITYTQQCTGAEWNANVDTNNLGTDILGDIAACNLSQVNWAIPNGAWSDHAGPNDQYGPSWVAAIVNAIGNNPKCAAGTKDAGQTFWKNTAIVVTWDDWGGWSDNEPAKYASPLPCTSSAPCQGDYQYGFRVPLLVVSAYTPAGYINNSPHDFGSVLRMIQGLNHLSEGQLGFADERATTDLHEFFTLAQPRTYQTIPAPEDACFFTSYSKSHAMEPPDDDD